MRGKRKNQGLKCRNVIPVAILCDGIIYRIVEMDVIDTERTLSQER